MELPQSHFLLLHAKPAYTHFTGVFKLCDQKTPHLYFTRNDNLQTSYLATCMSGNY